MIVTDSLWKRRYSAAPALLGKTMLLDGIPHVVVGILPPTFRFFSNRDLSARAVLEAHTDVFRPIAIDGPNIGLMGEFNFAAIGRMKPGIALPQARAELNTIEAEITAQLKRSERAELQAVLTPLKEQITGQSRRGLLVLLAAVGAVLLIVCVNLANLMLARAMAQQRNAAIRAALGASRGDLLRQVLAEALLLAAGGGALGIAASYWGVSLLVKTAPVDLPGLASVQVNSGVLGFGLLLTLITGLLFGVLPALRLARAEPADALRSGGRAATESAHGLQLRRLLVASEVALSALLLIAAGLLLHSFVRLLQVDKGFDATSVIAADLTLPASQYQAEADRVKFLDRLLLRLRAVPGVKSFGLVSVLPLEGEGWSDVVSVVGRAPAPYMDRPLANYRFASPGYFNAIGIPLLRGRFLEDRDRQVMPAVISSTLAQRVFPGENPVGKRFRRGDDDEAPFEIVGVAGDVSIASLQKPAGLVVYVPYWFRSRMKFSVVARTTVDPVLIAPALRSAVRELDANIPLGDVRTLQQVVTHAISPRRFQMTLVLLFAAAALVLASLGIYGVVSYMVTQRRNEIGIRMALGAASQDVYLMILQQGLAPVAAGLVIGILGAVALSRFLGSLLFQVSRFDPSTFAGVTLLLAFIATMACLGPSRRAVRANPSSVLRID